MLLHFLSCFHSYSVGVEEIILNKEGADLALVKVKGEINTQIFPPICLPQTGDSLQSSSGVVKGYGRNKNNTGPGSKLKVKKENDKRVRLKLKLLL